MPRLNVISPAQTTGLVQPIYDDLTKKMGKVVNIFQGMANKGFVKDHDIGAVRQAGYSDGQIAESIGYIGLATFSNLFNHVTTRRWTSHLLRSSMTPRI